VAERLAALKGGAVGVVNAASRRDVDAFVLGLLKAEARGKRFLYRTAASFVAARAAIPPRPLLSAAELELPQQGGVLFVVGSHVPRSSEQLAHLLEHSAVAGIEIEVRALLSHTGAQGEVARAAEATQVAIEGGGTAAVYTSRELVAGPDAEASLAIGRRISEALVALVQGVDAPLRCLIGKGGITASDVATKALRMRRALVLGQILPGVPLWRMGPESARPGLPYVVFPGNVGGPDALSEVLDVLEG
jgi:uncharacterized protein YgbK (DUF1537 family)